MQKKLQKFWNKAYNKAVFVFCFCNDEVCYLLSPTLISLVQEATKSYSLVLEFLLWQYQILKIAVPAQAKLKKKMLQEKGQRKKPSEQLTVQHNILH